VALDRWQQEVQEQIRAPQGVCSCGRPVTVISVGSWKSSHEYERTCGLHWPLRATDWHDFSVVAVWQHDHWTAPAMYGDPSLVPSLWLGTDESRSAEAAAARALVREAEAEGISPDRLLHPDAPKLAPPPRKFLGLESPTQVEAPGAYRALSYLGLALAAAFVLRLLSVALR
jgi:hypothetical protein